MARMTFRFGVRLVAYADTPRRATDTVIETRWSASWRPPSICTPAYGTLSCIAGPCLHGQGGTSRIDAVGCPGEGWVSFTIAFATALEFRLVILGHQIEEPRLLIAERVVGDAAEVGRAGGLDLFFE